MIYHTTMFTNLTKSLSQAKCNTLLYNHPNLTNRQTMNTLLLLSVFSQ